MKHRLLAAGFAALVLLSGCRGKEGTAQEQTDKTGSAANTPVTFASASPQTEAVPALYALDAEEDAANGLTLSATEQEENAVQLTGSAVLFLTQSDLNKLGDASSGEEKDQGRNACIFVGSGSALTAAETSVTTDAYAAPALCVTGEGSNASLRDVIMASAGADSPLIRADAAAVVTLFHATLMSEGANSPCIFAANCAVSAESGSMRSGDAIAKLMGAARLTFENVDLSGRSGFVFLPQAEQTEHALLAITGGYLSAPENGPVFEAAGCAASARMENVTLTGTPSPLIRADGGSMELTVSRQQLLGAVQTQQGATAKLILADGSGYTGAFPADGAPSVSLQLDATSTWQVTGESFLSVLSAPDTAFLGIQSNGFNVYYDSSQTENVMLNAQSYLLPGGGFLIPMI